MIVEGDPLKDIEVPVGDRAGETLRRASPMRTLDDAPIADVLDPAAGVPVIDLGGADDAAIEAIGRACAEWGFFQVVGHGVDAALIAAAMAETRAFFALPKDEKRALLRSRDNPWGYYDRELTKNARDKKEIFDIGPEPTSADPFAGRTPWPDSPARFEPALRAYFHACAEVAGRLMEKVSQSLGAPEGAMQQLFEPAHTSFLRLNFYPVDDPLGAEAAAAADLGIHHHTDAGALTVLHQDRVGGLQVYRDGAWYLVAPLDEAFVINIGDMVQVWSNDLYRAPIHRVLAMEAADRYSLPFFYNPAYAATVAPLEAALRRTGAPHYAGIPWGDYRRRRADGDFADYGAEVQINDYRL